MRLRVPPHPGQLTLGYRLLLLVGLLVVVLPSSAVAEECPNAAFRTGPSANLPDCRAYELVTPPFKNGAAVGYGFQGISFNTIFAPSFVSPDGESVPFNSQGSFAGAESNEGLLFADYVSSRSGAGWQTSAMVPSVARYNLRNGAPFAATSDSPERALWAMRTVSQPNNALDFYLLGSGGSVVDVGPVVPPTAGELASSAPVEMDGMSADGSHIVFQASAFSAESKPFPWPGTVAGTVDSSGTLLEYVGTGNREPLLVGVEDGGGYVNGCEVQEIGGDIKASSVAFLSLSERKRYAQLHNAVSVDGDTIFFTDLCKGELFARIDNGLPGAHTVAISEPDKEDCALCDTEGVRQAANFLGASADGSRVFFETSQPLLGSDTSSNVYEYDFDAPAGERVVRVSGGDGTVSNPVADVEGAPQVSADGSHIYFIAKGALTANPNYAGEVARTGANNLYVYERDASYPSGRLTFIADLSEGDVGALLDPVNRGGGGFRQLDTGVYDSTVSPDGRYLVWLSSVHLTSDDASSGLQLFEYDAQENRVTRVSVGQDGFNDNGNTGNFGGAFFVAEDGSVFFESEVGLTPQALNNVSIGGPYAINVYEYREGNVYLISDGHDVSTGNGDYSEVELLGASANGRDVFFTSTDRLVGQDTDTQRDIYDARVDGGFPGPSAPVECQADACQGTLSAAPVLLTAGSELQDGEENVTPTLSTAPGKPASPTHKVKRKAKPKQKSKLKPKRKRHGGSHGSGARRSLGGRHAGRRG